MNYTVFIIHLQRKKHVMINSLLSILVACGSDVITSCLWPHRIATRSTKSNAHPQKLKVLCWNCKKKTKKNYTSQLAALALPRLRTSAGAVSVQLPSCWAARNTNTTVETVINQFKKTLLYYFTKLVVFVSDAFLISAFINLLKHTQTVIKHIPVSYSDILNRLKQ